jgi:hypothetical protein
MLSPPRAMTITTPTWSDVVVGVLILALAMAYVVLVLREPRPPR